MRSDTAEPPGRAPAAWTMAVLWLVFAVTFYLCRQGTGGMFVYPMDDAYIHLALAKNLADHGIYGVTPYEFTPTSSSIVWPLLLAGARYLTRSDLVPLAFNVVFASALALTLDGVLLGEGYGRKGRFFVNLGILFAVPLLPIVFIGMEHTAHALTVVVLAVASAEALSAEESTSGARLAQIALFSLAAAALRYESLFLVGALGALALARRRLPLAFALGIGAAIPILAYAAYSISHGGPFFPISVLLKRAETNPYTFVPVLGHRLLQNPHLLALLTLLSLAHVQGRSRGFWDRRQLLVVVAAAVIVLHVAFAQLLWFYRYEAYAVVLGLIALAGPCFAHRAQIRRLWLPSAVIMLPLVVRGLGGVRAVPRASANIYEQQVQMAQFLSRYYAGRRVVLNDIGAVAYFADVQMVDLVGLGSPRVAQEKAHRMDRGLDPRVLDALTRDAAVAIVYDGWFPGALPEHWQRIGLWRISHNTVCAKDTVSIYAVDPAEQERLTSHLREFAPKLPRSVEQSGPYTH